MNPRHSSSEWFGITGLLPPRPPLPRRATGVGTMAPPLLAADSLPRAKRNQGDSAPGTQPPHVLVGHFPATSAPPCTALRAIGASHASVVEPLQNSTVKPAA